MFSGFCNFFVSAASILRMLHHSFGKEVFVDALHDYLEKNKYGNAKPEQLFNAISSRIDKDKVKIPGELKVNVRMVLESWTSKPGYPVVNASRSDSTVHLSQVLNQVVIQLYIYFFFSCV